MWGGLCKEQEHEYAFCTLLNRRGNALSHNGNALFIALPLSLFFGIFFLCSSKEQQHDEWHLF
jgi:hypothetical protein